MGKGPDYPDPKETASAQTSTNIGTAVANTMLGNANQYSPYGSVEYEQTGNKDWTNPADGKTYSLPQYNVTTTLSPEQQKLYDLSNQANTNLAQLGVSQSSRLQSLLDSPMSLQGAPEVSAPEFQQYGDMRVPQQGMMSGSARTPYGQARSMTAAVQNRVADAGDIQNRVRTRTGGIQTDVGDAGAITKTYGTDYDAARQDVQDALMARMNPSLKQERSRLETQLANQGIGIGTEAYDRAMRNYNQQANDARMSAVLAGGQEQSRLAGLEAARAGFENQAQAQQYGQLANDQQARNAAMGQIFGQEMAAGQFRNQAQAQQYGQNAQDMAARNAAVAQRYSQDMGAREFANSAQAQSFGQQLSKLQTNNQSKQANYQNRLAQMQAQNELAQQQYGNQIDDRSRYLQEQYALRNQPINEIAALLSGSQVTAPSFQPYNAGKVANTDYAGLVDAKYKADQQAYSDRMGGIFGLGSSLLKTLPFM